MIPAPFTYHRPSSVDDAVGLLASLGVVESVKADPTGLGRGVNCWDGACTYEAVAEGVGVPYTPLAELL